MKKINQNSDTTTEIRDQALNVVDLLVQRLPKGFSSNPQLLKGLFDVYFAHILSSVTEPDEEWKCPPKSSLFPF